VYARATCLFLKSLNDESLDHGLDSFMGSSKAHKRLRHLNSELEDRHIDVDLVPVIVSSEVVDAEYILVSF